MNNALTVQQRKLYFFVCYFCFWKKYKILNLFQETRNAATPLELDDDSVSVQSQENDQKQVPEIPSLILSKTSSESKESTPQFIEEQKVKSVDELKKETPELEKKV